MHYLLTAKVSREALDFKLKSSCLDCYFYIQKTGLCAHEWPNTQQKKCLEECRDDGVEATISLCKEFELR